MSIIIHVADRDTGEYIGQRIVDDVVFEDGGSHADGIGYRSTPMARRGKFAIVRSDDGKKWLEIEDHRGTVFSKENKSEVEWKSLGPLPETLTSAKPLSENDVWDGDSWIFIAPQIAEEYGAAEREERNRILALTDSLVTRHRDQLDLGAGTDLTDAEYMDLLSYRQKIRDVPDQPLFPKEIDWPNPPLFISEMRGS